MIKMIANWIVNGLALYVVSYIVPGVSLENFGAALISIVVISLLNSIN